MEAVARQHQTRFADLANLQDHGKPKWLTHPAHRIKMNATVHTAHQPKTTFYKGSVSEGYGSFIKWLTITDHDISDSHRALSLFLFRSIDTVYALGIPLNNPPFQKATTRLQIIWMLSFLFLLSAAEIILSLSFLAFSWLRCVMMCYFCAFHISCS